MGKTEQTTTEGIENSLENGTVDAELAEIVKMSVENDMAEAEKAAPEAPPETAAPEVDAPETPVHETDKGEEPKPAEIDDALTERAVRAGLSLAEIKGITSKDVLEGIVGRLEDGAGKTKGDGSEQAAPAADEPTGEDGNDPLADIDWDEFDPQIATVMKALQSQNAAMRKEIASLRKAGESAQTQSFFETQYGKLDEGVRRHVDAVAKGKLKQKFDMLEAGYKAVNADVKRADVFQEAARLVLGDKLDAARAESDAEKLARRKGLAIAQPTRASGKAPQKTEDDVDREIAAFLEKKYPES